MNTSIITTTTNQSPNIFQVEDELEKYLELSSSLRSLNNRANSSGFAISYDTRKLLVAEGYAKETTYGLVITEKGKLFTEKNTKIEFAA